MCVCVCEYASSQCKEHVVPYTRDRSKSERDIWITVGGPTRILSTISFFENDTFDVFNEDARTYKIHTIVCINLNTQWSNTIFFLACHFFLNFKDCHLFSSPTSSHVTNIWQKWKLRIVPRPFFYYYEAGNEDQVVTFTILIISRILINSGADVCFEFLIIWQYRMHRFFLIMCKCAYAHTPSWPQLLPCFFSPLLPSSWIYV